MAIKSHVLDFSFLEFSLDIECLILVFTALGPLKSFFRLKGRNQVENMGQEENLRKLKKDVGKLTETEERFAFNSRFLTKKIMWWTLDLVSLGL